MYNKLCFPCTEPLRCRFLSTAGAARFLSSSRLGEPLQGISPEEKRTTKQEFIVQPRIINGRSVSLLHSSAHGGILVVDLESENENQLCCISPDRFELFLVEEGKPKLEPLHVVATADESEGYLIQTLSGEMAVVDGGYATSGSNTDVVLVFLNNSSLWKMEILSGELCYLQNLGIIDQEHNSTPKQLSCGLRGNLSTNEAFGGHEVWRLVDVPGPEGHFWINNWAHGDKVLTCNAYGAVTTANLELPVPRSTKWTVETVEGRKGVLIQSVEQKGYLAMSKDGKPFKDKKTLRTVIDPDHPECSCYWAFEPANRNKFRIITNKQAQDAMERTKKDYKEGAKETVEDGKTAAGPRFLSVSMKLNLPYCTPKLQDATAWKLTYTKDGRVSVQFQDDWYLAMDINPHASASITLSKRPYFWRARGPRAGVIFLADDQEDVPLALPCGTQHAWVWSLVPCMPDKGLNWDKVNQLSIYGATAMVGMLVLPFTATAAVSALGFGASGIVAGSTAAGMMAAEATAAGGMIATGGTVATLQSIGAVGLGWVGTSVTVGAGAAMGVGATAAVAGGEGEDTTNGTATENNDPRHPNRPFAGWKDW
jgi:hypothetical protein